MKTHQTPNYAKKRAVLMLSGKKEYTAPNPVHSSDDIPRRQGSFQPPLKLEMHQKILASKDTGQLIQFS